MQLNYFKFSQRTEYFLFQIETPILFTKTYISGKFLYCMEKLIKEMRICIRRLKFFGTLLFD